MATSNNCDFPGSFFSGHQLTLHRGGGGEGVVQCLVRGSVKFEAHWPQIIWRRILNTFLSLSSNKILFIRV